MHLRLYGSVAGMLLLAATAAAQEPRFQSLSADLEGTCALTVDGIAWCWGGYATYGRRTREPRPLSSERLASISLSSRTACALTLGHRALCIGENVFGLLGAGLPLSGPRGETFQRFELTPVAGGHRFRAVSAGGGAACGIAEDDAVWCWGHNLNGQFGNGVQVAYGTFSPDTGFDGVRPVEAITGMAFTTIEVGYRHSCALDADGTAWCWGTNEYGQLGDGTTEPRFVPGPVAGDHRFRGISVNPFRTCGVTLEGEGLCWGHNDRGALGDGTRERRTVPTPVTGEHRWRVISLGTQVTCGITDGGAAWCWGMGLDGSLGTGEVGEIQMPSNRAFLYSSEPLAVVGGHRFATLSAGYDHVCGITEDGEVWCWGGNGADELGVPRATIERTGTPQRVPFNAPPARRDR